MIFLDDCDNTLIQQGLGAFLYYPGVVQPAWIYKWGPISFKDIFDSQWVGQGHNS